MIIYNKGLTGKLEALFGETVLSWTNAKIRNELETSVAEVHEVVMGSGTKKIRDEAFEIFQSIKDIDDEFTDLYINELDFKV